MTGTTKRLTAIETGVNRNVALSLLQLLLDHHGKNIRIRL